MTEGLSFEEFDALLGTDDLTALDDLSTLDMVNHAIAPDRPKGLAGTREFLGVDGDDESAESRINSRAAVSAESSHTSAGQRL